MISKVGAAILFSVVALFVSSPTTVFAKSSNPTKTKKLQKQLKALGPDAPASKVAKLVQQLTKLDPVKANTYVKAGLKTGALSDAEAQALSDKVVKIVLASPDVPQSTKDKIETQVTNTVDKYVPPTPTPTPYQAMVSGSTIERA